MNENVPWVIAIIVFGVLFGGDPDLMSAIISQLQCSCK
jgi:hypothetical protein